MQEDKTLWCLYASQGNLFKLRVFLHWYFFNCHSPSDLTNLWEWEASWGEGCIDHNECYWLWVSPWQEAQLHFRDVPRRAAPSTDAEHVAGEGRPWVLQAQSDTETGDISSLWPEQQIQSSPCSSARMIQDVFSLLALTPCLLLSGDFPQPVWSKWPLWDSQINVFNFNPLCISLCQDYLPANKVLCLEIKGETTSPFRMCLSGFATPCFMENMERCCIHNLSLISVFVNRFITPSAELYCSLLHIYSLSIYIVQLWFILFPFYN